jgi:hypothetical protein
MDKITTSHISDEKKLALLKTEAIKAVEGATEADLQGKLTVRGQEVLDKMRYAARRMFCQSNDRSWIKVSQSFMTSRQHQKGPIHLDQK